MKKLLLFLILVSASLLSAQNIWKPFNCNAYFVGADSEGNLFAMAGYTGLIRSTDEGASWSQVNDYYMRTFMAFSPNGRLFIFPADHNFVFYSDDHGDTWQQTASHSLLNYYMSGAYAVNNDTLLLWGENHLHYTLDAGATWHDADMSFIGDEYHQIGDVIANEAGDVYASKWYYSGDESGIFHSTLSDMQNWELAAFDGAVVLHMEFDPEGNVVAGSSWGGIAGFQQEPGFYLLYGDRFVVANNGLIYDMHFVGDDSNNYLKLRYSANHGETFYEYGEALPIQQFPPGGEGDGYLWKSVDGHLYFYGHNDYKKSVFNTNDIHYIEGEVVVSHDAFAFGNYPYGYGQAIRVDDDHIYPVTVDGFRPDPTDLTRLVVRCDTIPMGAIIGAFGTIKEMHDYTGHSENVLDIQQTTEHYYDAIIAKLDPEEDDKVKIHLPKPPYTSYFITINGEKQDWPLVFNGTPYYNTDLLTFIGHCDIMLDPYANQFYGMELADIQPFKDYTFHLQDGTLTTDYWDQPCLSSPCNEEEDQHFLTFLWGDFTFPTPFYPMHNGQLYRDSFINNDVFREGMHVEMKGIRHTRYDIPGYEVNVVELVEMDTDEETTLTGTIEWAPMPYTANVPLPGLIIAFVANGRTYYLDNDQNPYDDWFIVGNDTIYVGQEIMATFTTRMLIDNGLDFYYRIYINQIGSINEIFPLGTEWYYEIQNTNGAITYQHLEYASDTAINSHRAKVLIRTNTQYDKELFNDVNHEYIYEDQDHIYWWNATLQDFTLLYDFGAEVGEEWTINVGEESIVLHVDGVDSVEYKGLAYRMLHVSDPSDFFSGDILCGVGHLTSFFPERLIKAQYLNSLHQDLTSEGLPNYTDHDFTVNGLRCYWQDGELILTLGNEDCDAIYDEIHSVSDIPNSACCIPCFTLAPNPTTGLLTLSLSTPRNNEIPLSRNNVNHVNHVNNAPSFLITSLQGQPLLSGPLAPVIDVSSLAPGIYFFTINNHTQKLIIQ